MGVDTKKAPITRLSSGDGPCALTGCWATIVSAGGAWSQETVPLQGYS